MSVTFVQRGNRPPANTTQIQKILDENSHLIQAIQEYQAKGQVNECIQYQQTLHRNLVYLASMADASQNIQAILPPPHQLQLGGAQPGQPSSHGAAADVPSNPQNVNTNNYPQTSQAYRGAPNPAAPNVPRPAGTQQPYNQRGYPQNQYQGQYQNSPLGAYPPQTQAGYNMNPNQHSYGPPGPQPQGYPSNSNYGPPITTAQNSNYPTAGHQSGNYPPSPMQQPYAAPANPANPAPYSGGRGVSSQNYSNSSGFQGPPMGSGYGGPGAGSPSSANYNAGANQNSSYPSQQFSGSAPPSGYPPAPTTQPNHSPQPGGGYPNQTPGSVSYGPPAAQSPTYSSPNTHNSNPQNGGTQAPSTNVSSQAYASGQPSGYSSSAQPPFSNPSSQPGSPAPSNYQTPVSQPPNSSSTNSQGYVPPVPQSYPPPGGSYPPHGYGSHPQPGYPPSQYPNSSYQYSRPPAPQPPPPQSGYGGYSYQPPSQ